MAWWRTVPVRPEALPPTCAAPPAARRAGRRRVAGLARRRAGARPAPGPHAPSAGRCRGSPSSAVSTTSTSARSRRAPSSTRAWCARRCCGDSTPTCATRALRHRLRRVPPPLQHQHPAQVEPGAADAPAGPQRRDQHAAGQPHLDQGPRAGARAPVWGERVPTAARRSTPTAATRRASTSMLELLVRSGRDPLEALLMLMPEPYEGTARPRRSSPATVRLLRVLQRLSQEAWDGPALVAFGDGRTVGAASTATACGRRAT